MTYIPTTPLITNETKSGNYKIYSAYYTNNAIILRNLKTEYREFHPDINEQQYKSLLQGLQFSLQIKNADKKMEEALQLANNMPPEQKKAFIMGLSFIDNEQNNPQKPAFVISKVV